MVKAKRPWMAVLAIEFMLAGCVAVPAPSAPTSSGSRSGLAGQDPSSSGNPTASSQQATATTSAPTPTRSVSPTASARPTPTLPPLPGVALRVERDVVYVLRNNWRRTGVGLVQVSFRLQNFGAQPRYPRCTVWLSDAAAGGRVKTLAWRGLAPVPAGSHATYRVNISKVPLNNDPRTRSVVWSRVTCIGTLYRVPFARPDAPPVLRVKLVSSESIARSGSRATLLLRFRITNRTRERVRPRCHAQVAGTRRKEPPVGSSVSIRTWTFDTDITLRPRGSVTTSYRAANAPVEVFGSRYYWLYTVRCWAS